MDHGRYVINKLIIMVDVIKINENIKVLEVRIFSILNCFLSILKENVPPATFLGGPPGPPEGSPLLSLPTPRGGDPPGERGVRGERGRAIDF